MSLRPAYARFAILNRFAIICGLIGSLFGPAATALAHETHSSEPGEEYTLLSIRGGQAFVVGGVGGKSGFVAGAQFMSHSNPRWGLGLDIAYFAFNRETGSFSNPSPSNMFRRDFSMLLTGRYVLRPQRPVSPFFLAGVGFHYFHAVHYDAPPAGAPAPTEIDLHNRVRLQGRGHARSRTDGTFQ